MTISKVSTSFFFILTYTIRYIPKNTNLYPNILNCLLCLKSKSEAMSSNLSHDRPNS